MGGLRRGQNEGGGSSRDRQSRPMVMREGMGAEGRRGGSGLAVPSTAGPPQIQNVCGQYPLYTSGTDTC